MRVGRLFIILVTFTLTFEGCYGDGEEVKDVEALEKIMQDLDFIEKAENADTSDKGDPATMKTRLETCEGIADRSHEITGDYQELVRTLLPLWNDCEAVWNNYLALAEWDFETNITDETEEKLTVADTTVKGTSHKLSLLARAFTEHSDYTNLSPDEQRQLRLLAKDDTPKDKTIQENLSKVLTEMQDIYSKATVDDKPMEPDITQIMATSRDPYELEKYWKEWRDETGAKMKHKYAEFVEFANTGAVENGYSDYGQSWLETQFDNVVDIRAVSEQLWGEVKPLYQRLHAFVRGKLRKIYPQLRYKRIFDSGAIPAHLTGNMWAQQWNNIYDIVKPFPEISEPNYDKALRDQGYDVDDMFDLAEKFYTSIGLYPMTDIFKKYSMKERPTDREVVCHASASDFYRKGDFRIKMCTKVNTEYLDVIHHEMGHIEYFMAYENQTTVYRDGANSGFHEAIGDTISLSVMTAKHMKTINLSETTPPTTTKATGGYTDDEKREINFLMKIALSKIAFLPFGYLIDKWRWDVFNGTVTESEYNRHWWDLRLKYQGIVPPEPRTENDFDPGAKFHIPSNSPYICYFTSFMLQFQFYEAMCTASGQYNKDTSTYLHTCDFYESTAAGDLLKNMMSLGKSQPWNLSLFEMTGSYDISSQSILRYFKPLDDWLKITVDPNLVGWNDQSHQNGKRPPGKGAWKTYNRYINLGKSTQSKLRRQQYLPVSQKNRNKERELVTLLKEIFDLKK